MNITVDRYYNSDKTEIWNVNTEKEYHEGK